MTPLHAPKRPKSLAKIFEMGWVRSFWPNARPHEAHRKRPITPANATAAERLTLDAITHRVVSGYIPLILWLLTRQATHRCAVLCAGRSLFVEFQQKIIHALLLIKIFPNATIKSHAIITTIAAP